MTTIINFKQKITLTCVCISILFFSCKEVEKVRYDQVQLIISTSCAVQGCHDDITSRNNLDFSTYSSMTGANGRKNSLNLELNGFYDRVVVKRNMPPNASMQEEDILLLEQWAQDGFLE